MKSKPKKQPAIPRLKKKTKPVPGRIEQSVRGFENIGGKRVPFVPMGDPEYPPGTIRVTPAKRKTMPKWTDFDISFMPIDGPTRRARRAMIGGMCFEIGGKKYMRPADPFVAKQLRRQEDRGPDEIEAFRALCGKNAGWLTSLCFEAMHTSLTQGDAVRESAWHLANAVARGDAGVILAFHKAVELVKKFVESGPDNKAKLVALIFCLTCETKTGFLPTKACVRKYLNTAKIRIPERHHESRDLFCGPILGILPSAKAGRKKLPPTVKKRRG